VSLQFNTFTEHVTFNFFYFILEKDAEHQQKRILCDFCSYYRVGQNKWPNLFLSELHQIFTKFANFWHKNSQDDRITWGTLIFHLT